LFVTGKFVVRGKKQHTMALCALASVHTGSSRYVPCYFIFVMTTRTQGAISSLCLASPQSLQLLLKAQRRSRCRCLCRFENCHIASRFYCWIVFSLAVHKIRYLKLRGFALYRRKITRGQSDTPGRKVGFNQDVLCLGTTFFLPSARMNPGAREESNALGSWGSSFP